MPSSEPRRRGLPGASLRRAVCASLLWVLVSGRVASGQAPSADPYRPLGRLEQESLDEALAALGLVIEPRPTGKVVGRIYVVNQDVFSRRDWLFQLLNVFHRTTRSAILERELLLRPGQPYDQQLVDESIRNLQAAAPLVFSNSTPFVPPELSSVVALVPVSSGQPGTVDLLAVTRDLWSLRFNTNFEFQQNTLSLFQTSLSENNLFGWRKYLSVGFDLDQGRAGVGPTYFDPNVGGSRLTLLASATAYYARDTQRYEGDSEQFSLRYPLYSLASRWGGGADVTRQDTVIRRFHGNQLRLEDLLATPQVEQLPYIFRYKVVTVDVGAVRSFGSQVIQRVAFGHRVDTRSSAVLPDFPQDPANPQLAQQFLAELAPVSERRSEPYLSYEVFTARYVVLRDLDTFDLRENHRLGPRAKVEVAYGVPALGADFSAVPVSGVAEWAVAPRGGYATASLQAAARLRADRAIDQSAGAQVFVATPVIARALRVVIKGEADVLRADTHRYRYFLGGSNGLRGYAIGDFEGTSQMVGHVEVRSLPLAVTSQRFGGLVFYDVGHAAPSLRQIVPYHDLGVGLRWLIPQLNSSVIRLDWAVATQSTTLTRAGLPGRFTAGFFQAF